jgi:hypothetical protein
MTAATPGPERDLSNAQLAGANGLGQVTILIDNINAEPDYGDEPPACCLSRVFLGRDSFACGGTPGHGGKHGYRLPWVTIEWDGRAERAADATPEPDVAPGLPHRHPFAARDCECPPDCECWQLAITPQPAPELAAAMAESRRYRQALQVIAGYAAGTATKQQIAIAAKRALEGK